MIKLARALNAWGTPEFENVFKDEVKRLEAGLLPLQEGLSHSSSVGREGLLSVLVLGCQETTLQLRVKTGLFYSGVVSGSCCADDPTPVDAQTEYCELLFEIEKSTAETTVKVVVS
ncbi:MAG: hypothetical protein GY703_13715 [Gammaproteobacteria bacterium]|nr:hypothetical protein [Gammaproteobacteria bacterium]